MATTLASFLSQHKVTNKGPFTHTSIGDTLNGIFPGTYNIPDDKFDEFMSIYYRDITVEYNCNYLTEKQLSNGPIAIDLDFRYTKEITTRQHTRDMILDVIMAVVDEAKIILDIPDTDIIPAYVFEKPDINTTLPEKNKDGVHLIFGINMLREHQIYLRKIIIPKLKSFLVDVPFINTIEEVYDYAVTSASANWQLFGSMKPANEPYALTGIYNIVGWDCNPVKNFNLEQDFNKLSIRYKGYKTYQIHPDFIMPAPAVVNKPVTTNINIVNINAKSELEMFVRSGIQHGMFELMSKGSNHKLWINTGFIIKGELGDNGEDLFVDLSRHDSKFVEDDVRACYKQLNRTIINDNKKPISIGSLIKYFKDTDLELAKIIIREVKSQVKSMVEDSTVELDPSKLDHLDADYMNSFSSDYPTQKKYFELFIAKIITPEPQFVYIEGSIDIGKKSIFFTEAHINTAFKHIRTSEMIGDNLILKPFTQNWLSDPSIRYYNRMDFCPVNDIDVGIQDDKNLFNLFTGYNPKIRSEFNKERSDIILQPFMDLGLELCGGVQKHFQYFLNLIGHLIQYPTKKVPICVIFKGKQGTGKSMYINTIGNLLGKDHYISSSNPKDFFGDYAEGFYHKLLVNLNECEGKNTFEFEGRIKSFISEDRITVNAKFQRPVEINNYALAIISSNKPNPIPIDVKSGDRRYTVYESTNKFLAKKYGTKFWTGLLAHFNRPEFIACLYNYFNTLNVDNIDWRSERPITDAYKQMCRLYTPIEAMFFEEYLQEYKLPEIFEVGGVECNKPSKWDDDIRIRTKEIYEKYVQYCKQNGFSNDKRMNADIKSFISRCEELDLPISQTTTHGYKIFKFIPSEIISFLVQKKYINRSEEDPDVVPVDETGENFNFDI
jgi:hypothetical protein